MIVETILREDAPFRLLLGSDAVSAARQTLTKRLNELEQWEAVSKQTDFNR